MNSEQEAEPPFRSSLEDDKKEEEIHKRKPSASFEDRQHDELGSPYQVTEVVLLRRENAKLLARLERLEKLLEQRSPVGTDVSSSDDCNQDLSEGESRRKSRKKVLISTKARRRTMGWESQKDVTRYAHGLREKTRGEDYSLPKGMPKLRIPKFKGGAEQFYQWVYKLESIFMLYQWDARVQAYIGKNALSGSAASWSRHREVCGKVFSTWNELKENLQEEFVPEDFDDNQMEALAQLRQVSTVRIYVEKFRELYESLPRIEDAVARSYFKKGLRTTTRKACQRRNFRI